VKLELLELELLELQVHRELLEHWVLLAQLELVLQELRVPKDQPDL
jgi:hypothetical protein